MKTKELIARLNELDPAGEQDVFVGNADILYLEAMPAYYDGAAHLITRRSETGYPEAMKIKREGNKIVLKSFSIDDFLLDDPNGPIDLTEASDYNKNEIKKWREESEKLNEDIRKKNQQK